VTEYLCKLGAETMPESYHMIGMKLEDTAEALTAAQKIGSLRLILICEIELGIALAKLQNFEVATNYYNEAMVLANMKRYHRFIGIISYFLGILYHDQGLAHDALSQYQYSLRFFEQDKHVYYQKSILIRIAQIYDVLGDLNNSADFYNKANNIVVDVEDIADEDRSWYTNMSQESRHEYTDIFQVLENSDLAYTRSKGIDVLMGRCAIFLKLGNEAEIGRLNDAIERQHQEEMRRKEIRWKIIWVVIVVFIVGVLSSLAAWLISLQI
jgi:tetratricopeptide (TPR) repeat protein